MSCMLKIPSVSSYLLNSFSGLFKARRADRSDKAPPWLSFAPNNLPMPGGWTDARYEQVRHYKHWVYVAVTRIADKIAQTFPNVSVARDGSPGAGPREAGFRERYLNSRLRNKALVPLQAHEELEPVPTDHPLVLLLRDANSQDTGFDLWFETVLHLLLTGNAYWWAPQNNAGLPTELWAIPPQWVWPVPGKTQLIEKYMIRPVEGSSQGVDLPYDDVIHFRRKSPISKIDGYGPLTGGALWVDGQESIDRTRWHSFKNGPMPQLKVTFTELNPNDQLLDRISARIQSRYAGEHNAGRPMMVPKGAEVEPLWISPKELDFKGSTEQVRESILALFGVPGVIAGITKNMTFGSVIAAQAGFCQFTINPILSFLGQSLTEKLAHRYDDRLRVWWEDQTPDDPAIEIKKLDLQARYGSISRNDIRLAYGRKPRPEKEADELLPCQSDKTGGDATGPGAKAGGNGDDDKDTGKGRKLRSGSKRRKSRFEA